MQQILALSRCAVIVRHWFEIDLDDASMEHGARIELRQLVPQPPGVLRQRAVPQDLGCGA